MTRIRPRHPGISLHALIAALLALGVALPALAAYDGRDGAVLGDAQGDFVLDEDDGPVPAFARVRHLENGLRVEREDGASEVADFNTPIYQGDVIETRSRQRAELQLPDGTLVRIDEGSRIEVFALTGESHALSDQTILGLVRGTMQVDVPDPSGGDRFRVDTSAASIYPLEPSALRIDVRGDEVTVTVDSGRAEVSGARGSEILRGGEATFVLAGRAPRAPRGAGVVGRDAFDDWVARRDDAYRLRTRPGRELADLPDEVRPYYSELSRSGDWRWTDDYGWAWSPAVEDDWRPYTRGYWDPGPYGPVWVSYEPWGWPVYRYGRWDHSVRFGWVWIPGRVFRPAHVAWYYGPSYVGWCPLGYWNSPVRVSISFGWGHSYFDHSPWVFTHFGGFYHRRPSYIYGYGHHHHGGRHHHASELRRHIGAGTGVVTRTAVHRGTHRQVSDGALPGDTFERARRAKTARRIDRTGETASSRRSFRDAEGGRTAVRSRAKERREDGTAARRRGTAPPRQGAAPSTPPIRRERKDRSVVRVYPGGRPDGEASGNREAVRDGRERAARAPTVRDRVGKPSRGSAPSAARRGEEDDRPAVRRPERRGEGKRSRPAAAPRRSSGARGDASSGVRRMLGGVAAPSPDRRGRTDKADRPARSRGDRGEAADRGTTRPAPRRESTRPPRRTAPRTEERPRERTRPAERRREAPSRSIERRSSDRPKAPSAARGSRTAPRSQGARPRSSDSGRSSGSKARPRSTGSGKQSGAKSKSGSKGSSKSSSKSSGSKGKSSRRR